MFINLFHENLLRNYLTMPVSTYESTAFLNRPMANSDFTKNTHTPHPYDSARKSYVKSFQFQNFEFNEQKCFFFVWNFTIKFQGWKCFYLISTEDRSSFWILRIIIQVKITNNGFRKSKYELNLWHQHLFQPFLFLFVSNVQCDLNHKFHFSLVLWLSITETWPFEVCPCFCATIKQS